jgi:PKD repeat protein
MHSIITGLGRLANLRLCALVACAAVTFVACDKVPLLAPPASTIRLSSASTNVQQNGTTELRATVLEPSGTPVHNGTTVTFTTNLGTVVPVDARTVNGVATVQFLGNGQSGKATVRAVSGGATSDPIELSVGAAAAGRVVVTANPNQVTAGSPALITAIVTDVSSNPLSGVLVSFSTDFGTLSSSVNSTGSNGQAQAILTTTRDATVTATVGTGTATTGTVKVTVNTTPEIAITTTTTNPTEGQPVTFAVALSGTGTTESFQSIVVDFGDGTTSGQLSGSNQNVVHTYDRSGTYLVEATGIAPSGSTKRATTSVSVADRGIVNVTITKSPDTAVNQKQPVQFTASVTGGGTVRSYVWNFGDGQTFNGSSQVTHSYSTSGTKTVTVTVTTTDGNSGKGQTQVVVN